MKAETRDALDTEFAGSLKSDIGQLAGYPVRPETGCLCLDLLQLFLAKIVIHHNTYHKHVK